MRRVDFSKIQSEIINSRESLIVNAGAGSGKTRVLVEKYLKVFEDHPNLKTDQVVAITFTEKAAQEMKDRIFQNIEEKLKNDVDEKASLYTKLKREIPFARISTIHSFCSRLIKENALYSCVDPDFDILSGMLADKRISWVVESYIFENLEKMKEFFKIQPTLTFEELIKWFKAGVALRVSNKTPLEVSDDLKENFKEHLSAIISKYEELSLKESALDFEELLILTRNMLKENEDLRQRYANYFKYIFVDEFQDTNDVQSEIIELLRANDNRVWYIGDPKQSIYSFRGADVDVFLGISKNATKRNLTLKEMNENYRSSPNLVRFYNAFFSKLFKDGKIEYISQIEKNAEDREKRVVLLDNDGGEKAEEARNVEAKAITAMVSNFVSRGYEFKDIAILVRSGGSIWQIEKALTDKGIPSYVVGGKEFFSKKEVRAIYNLIGVLLDPYDIAAMSGLLLSPFFNLSIDELLELKRDGKNLYDGLEKKYPDIKSIVQQLLSLKNNVDASKIIRTAIQKTNYLGKIAIEKDGDKKIANVMKFLEIMDSLDVPSWDINQIHRVMEMESEAREEEAIALSENANVVKIMNVHKSKGLEFPIVFIAQMSKGTSNNKKKANEEKKAEEIEEEKRVLYVAMTRAKEYLVLSREISHSNNPKNGKWNDFLKDTNFVENKHWKIPNEMEKLVKIIKSPKYVPIETKEKPQPFNLNKWYLQTPSLKNERKLFSVTELFEEVGQDFDPQTSAYGNIAHAILEKVGSVKLEEALIERTFLKYPPYMVETVKGVLSKLVDDPLIKEIESSNDSRSEFAVEGYIPNLDIHVIGKIDKIIKTSQGNKIIDFKYSNYNEKKAMDYEFQIMLYTFFYSKLTGEKTSGVIFFLKDGKKSYVEAGNENSVMEKIERRINEIAQK